MSKYISSMDELKIVVSRSRGWAKYYLEKLLQSSDTGEKIEYMSRILRILRRRGYTVSSSLILSLVGGYENVDKLLEHILSKKPKYIDITIKSAYPEIGRQIITVTVEDDKGIILYHKSFHDQELESDEAVAAISLDAKLPEYGYKVINRVDTMEISYITLKLQGI